MARRPERDVRFIGGSVIAAIETSGTVRFLFSILAAAFGLVLLYTLYVLTGLF